MNRKHHQGFTLIEIMVVVTIIGIMTGLIAVTMVTTDPQKQLNREALRFKSLIQMAQEEALFSQQEIGVIVDERGYKFARWGVVENEAPTEEGEEESELALPVSVPGVPLVDNIAPPTWNLIADETAFREHQLDEEYEIILEVDHEQIDLNAGEDPEKEKAKDAKDILEEEEEIQPSIYVMSSGELSPFVMEIYLTEDSDITVKVSGNETGKIWIGEEEDEDDF